MSISKSIKYITICNWGNCSISRTDGWNANERLSYVIQGDGNCAVGMSRFQHWSRTMGRLHDAAVKYFSPVQLSHILTRYSLDVFFAVLKFGNSPKFHKVSHRTTDMFVCGHQHEEAVWNYNRYLCFYIIWAILLLRYKNYTRYQNFLRLFCNSSRCHICLNLSHQHTIITCTIYPKNHMRRLLMFVFLVVVT